MKGASVQDVSPACCESFGPTLCLCLGNLRTQLHVLSEPLSLPQALPWRESESGRHFPPPGPTADYISQKLPRTQSSPFFACGTLVVRGRESARGAA